MGKNVFDMISTEGASESMLDRLSRSDFDELVEADLIYDRCRNLYHTEGKYQLFPFEGAFSDALRACLDYAVHPDDRGALRDLMQPDTLLERLAKAEQPGALRAELRFRLRDGGWRWVEQIVLSGAQHGFGEGFVRIFLFDIQNRQEGKLAGAAPAALNSDRDEMTGLLRKKPFFAAGKALVREKSADWCLVSIDIEHFKLFNEWYGHESGDLLLSQIGGILKRAEERFGALAGYMGQDDFCVLLPYNMDDIGALFEEIQRLIASRGTSVGFMPAFGISKVGEKGSVMVALDRASIAAGQVKGDFRTRIQQYDPAMQNKTEWEYCLLSEFQRGLKNHELYFCLQPQCLVPSGLVVGAESLARWRMPDGETVPPDTFVPVLEKYGFITDLDEYIWEGVCSWLHRWISDGNTPIPVSINVSQVDFIAIDVPEYIIRLTEKYNLPRSTLKVEITESAYVNDAELIRDAVGRLREAGFLVFMDDFGSGYSSLNMLRTLSVDAIKLDAQFLHMSEQDEKKGVHILETVVNMTQAMAVPIIVEGVESAEQAHFLEQLGCRYIQGFYYYHPMPVADFEKLIRDKDNIDTGGFSFVANQQFRAREFMDSNIYTDAMLNNILGAAAFYCWDGKKNVDIVRYNEQFIRLVNVPDFYDRLTGIQQYFHPEDVQTFFDLLAQAEEDHLNGSSGVMGIYRTDGSLGRFFEHFFFLEETENGKIFYGAMQDVTEIARLQHQMSLLSEYSSDSIVFLLRRNGQWTYRVVVHGLRGVMGLSQEDFERELNDGSFYRRLDKEAAEWLINATLNVPSKVNGGLPFRIKNERGEPLEMYMRIDYVHNTHEDVEYILTFRRREDT